MLYFSALDGGTRPSMSGLRARSLHCWRGGLAAAQETAWLLQDSQAAAGRPLRQRRQSSVPATDDLSDHLRSVATNPLLPVLA